MNKFFCAITGSDVLNWQEKHNEQRHKSNTQLKRDELCATQYAIYIRVQTNFRVKYSNTFYKITQV